MSFLAREVLEGLGFARLGEDVRVDESARFQGIDRVSLGSHVRIDAFVLVTAGPAAVEIGDHVHVAAGCFIFGTEGVRIEDFCGLSARVSIFSTNDDYSGGALTNPTVPEDLRKVTRAPVHLRRHAIVGCGSVVMPGVELGVGASVGALSYVNKNVPEFMVVSGNPLRRIGTRSRDVLERERELLER